MSDVDRRGFIRTAAAGLGASLDKGAAAPLRAGPKIAATVFDVRAFGAKGDGVTLDTRAIQQAIDACDANGGGTVVLHGGTFLT